MILRLQCLEEVNARYGLLINKAKTKIMMMDRLENKSSEIREIQGIEVVAQFTISDLLQKIMVGRVWNLRADSAVGTALVNALVFSVCLYESEIWTVWEMDRKKIVALEMWCFRCMLWVFGSRTYISHTFQYFGHIIRAETIESFFVRGNVNRAKKIGRSPTKWKNSIWKATCQNFPDFVKNARTGKSGRNLGSW